ncbi:MAG: metallophosphoesterase [Candidatus Binatia bacterium]
MSVVLHLSDPHFGTEREVVIDALVGLVRREQPDLAVLSGDITQRARRTQFRAAQRFVDRLTVPTVFVLPGNHDIPLFNLFARVWFPYTNYQRAFGFDLQPTYESENLLVIGVNTTRPYRHIDGEVSCEQIDQVAERLYRATQQQLRMVVTHQPVHVIRPQDEMNLLHGHRQAADAWSQAGADLLLGGHIHLPYVCPLPQPRKDVQRQVWVVQAGTAVSTRTRRGAPNSINLIRYVPTDIPRVCSIERWDYQESAQCFQLIQSTGIQLGLDLPFTSAQAAARGHGTA